MSQNTRATARRRTVRGRIWNVFGSGWASTSLSCTRLKPSMAEPSKVMPSSRAFSSSAGVMVNDLGVPSTSVNQSWMNRTRAPRPCAARSPAGVPCRQSPRRPGRDDMAPGSRSVHTNVQLDATVKSGPVLRYLGRKAMSYKAEYIWIDGTEPTPLLRSKTKIIADGDDPPIWGFDGSSTNQAPGQGVGLRAAARCSCAPTRSAAATTSWCCAEVLLTDMTPHPTNTRAAARRSPRSTPTRSRGSASSRSTPCSRAAARSASPSRRLPRPAGPVLLRRRRRRHLRPPARRGAPRGLPRCRPSHLRHQRRGHARPVGVPGRPAGPARRLRPAVGRPLAALPHRRGLRHLRHPRPEAGPGRLERRRRPHQLLHQGHARELRRRSSPPARRSARTPRSTSPTTASASRTASPASTRRRPGTSSTTACPTAARRCASRGRSRRTARATSRTAAPTPTATRTSSPASSSTPAARRGSEREVHRATAHAGRGAEPGPGRRHRDRRLPVLRPARPDAALLGPGARAHRGRLRGRLRLRRLVDPRLPGDPGVRHAPDPRPEHRRPRPVPPATRSTSTASCATRSPARATAATRATSPRRPRTTSSPPASPTRATSGPRRSSSSSTTCASPRTSTRRTTTASTRSRASGTPRGRGAQPRLQAPLQGGLLPRPAHGPLPGPALRDDPHDGAPGHRDRDPAPRGRHRRPGRDRHALRHAAAHGRQAHALQVRREERGLGRRQVGHVHAQADLPGQRLGHALPPVAVEGRRAAVLRRDRLRRACPTWPAGTSAACSSTPAPSSPSPRRRPTATSAWCPATRRRSTSCTASATARPPCRIPLYSKSPKAKRVEFRCPDPSCNPYLAFSAMLMAGLDGIAQPHRAARRRSTRTSTTCRPRSWPRCPRCPGSLDEALAALEADNDFLKAGGVFTDDLIETWIDYKRTHEIDAVRLRPHPYEFALYYDISSPNARAVVVAPPAPVVEAPATSPAELRSEQRP